MKRYQLVPVTNKEIYVKNRLGYFIEVKPSEVFEGSYWGEYDSIYTVTDKKTIEKILNCDHLYVQFIDDRKIIRYCFEKMRDKYDE